MKYLCVIAALLTANTTYADVYRWTDEKGEVHYTDKKPSTDADNITSTIKKQNIDTSTEEQRKVGQILRKENDADRAFYQQQQAEQQKKINEQTKRCNEARRYLRNISGPVQFIDDDGKPVYVSERERQAREAEFKTIVERECTQ